MQYANVFQPGPKLPATPIAGAATAIVTGGVPVVVFPAGTIRNGAFIRLDISSTGTLFVSMVGPAGTVPSGTNEVIYGGSTWEAPGPLLTAVTANSTEPLAFTAVSW
jgi:hypothetical protein